MSYLDRAVQTWDAFHQIIKAPETETEYLELLDFTKTLIEQYNTDLEPYRSLWRLVAGYLQEFEAQNQEPITVSLPHELLEFQMQQHGLSQYQFAKEGVVSQSYLSKLLRGERSMGKRLAVRLAKRFHLPENFFWSN